MSTIEDSILKQNVPGQWSGMDDRSDRRQEEQEHDSQSEGEDEDQATAGPSQPQMTETSRLLTDRGIDDDLKHRIMSERASKRQTGAKGVMADYRAEQQLKQAERDARAAEREAALHRIAYGSTAPAAPPQPLAVSGGDIDEDELDDEDELFMQQFRAARLRELQSQVVQPVLPRYESVDTLSSQEELVEQVTVCDPRTTVVVHVFEPSVSACVMLNRRMEELATLWTDVRFFRIQASDTNLAIDRVALPAISVYRNGDIVTVLAGLVEELGDNFCREDIEWLLESSDGWDR